MLILFIIGIVSSFLGTGYMMWVQHQQQLALSLDNRDEELAALENDMWLATRISYFGYALAMIYLIYTLVIV